MRVSVRLGRTHRPADGEGPVVPRAPRHLLLAPANPITKPHRSTNQVDGETRLADQTRPTDSLSFRHHRSPHRGGALVDAFDPALADGKVVRSLADAAAGGSARWFM